MATKAVLAADMIDPALNAGIRAEWIIGDALCGCGAVRPVEVRGHRDPEPLSGPE
jgi:SRSO17 transposase